MMPQTTFGGAPRIWSYEPVHAAQLRSSSHSYYTSSLNTSQPEGVARQRGV